MMSNTTTRDSRLSRVPFDGRRIDEGDEGGDDFSLEEDRSVDNKAPEPTRRTTPSPRYHSFYDSNKFETSFEDTSLLTRQRDEAAALRRQQQRKLLAELVPEEYLYDPRHAEPALDHLRAAVTESSSNNDPLAANAKTPNRPQEPTLQQLLEAADKDVILHTARVRAVLANDASIVQNVLASMHSRDEDTNKKERQLRNRQRKEQSDMLLASSNDILKGLDIFLDTTAAAQQKQHMTLSELMQQKLYRWQSALELYVYCPTLTTGGVLERKIDLLGLLERLCEGCGEEEELSEALNQATLMCDSLVEKTTLAVRDATEEAVEAEDAYQIRLQAHTILAQRVLQKSGEIEGQFRTNGREALKIGHQLEMAESQRRQCEEASLLIRRWWMMENLAEQEELTGEEILIQEEIQGRVPSSSCRMDPLFTKSENSLEAARALKALRAVVKSRGNAGGGGGGGGLLDPQSVRRFDLTSRLIQKTSAALEARLLNSFSDIYTKGGTYDFSSTQAASRPGRLNWATLKEYAESLMSFDSGRSLHKRYVGLVVTTRFPELFEASKKKESENGNDSKSGSVERGHASDDDSDGSDEEEFDMDATRSQLSSLFHRVCEVCTAEFQLIAHVFSTDAPAADGTSTISAEIYPLQVARALLQRVVSDPENGLQARITDLLASIDRRGDFDAGAKKLDTFVVIHEKAAGLFSLLKEAAEGMLVISGAQKGPDRNRSAAETAATNASNARAVTALVQFLTSQEIALSNSHRRGYLNLELRLLHHECCAGLDRIGAKLQKPIMPKDDNIRGNLAASVTEYRAPLLPLDKEYLKKAGFAGLLNGPLKQSVLRQPLIHATDSLARARLMFGGGGQASGGDVNSTARVIIAIYSQMCNFYGQSYLFPIIETLGERLNSNPPSTPPSLPFDEDASPHDLGVDGNFWVGMERIHSAAKAFDRELWAEQRTGSVRVWEILVETRSGTSLTVAKERRIRFFQELEKRGEAAILKALDTLSTHIQWILVTGGEGMLATGGTRLLHNLTGQGGGPYAVPAGSSLDASNSPAVKSLTYCLRSQFVHVQAALTPQSLSSFWTALSMRLYDILVARLLQHYYVSTVGAVVLSRDVEALRSVAMLAGTDHSHWDNLRELLTLYMTPPDSLKTMLVGADGDVNSGKGLFARSGRDQSLVFMSRRIDYRIKTNQGTKKCQWAVDLLEDLGVEDPTDGAVNIARFAAERKS